MKYKIFIPVLVNSVLNGIVGLSLHIPCSKILMLILYSSLFELAVFLVTNKSLATKYTSSQVLNRLKEFLTRTKWFQIVLISYLIIRIYLGIEPWLLLMYSHILILFNSMGYVLYISNINLKRK
jgi:hypothetical protein